MRRGSDAKRRWLAARLTQTTGVTTAAAVTAVNTNIRRKQSDIGGNRAWHVRYFFICLTTTETRKNFETKIFKLRVTNWLR